MKKLATLLVTLLITITSFAQQGINYKAVIKDDIGNVLASQTIGIKFTITRYIGQEIQYVEEQYPETDSNGIIIVNIGEGNVVSGDFFNIDWSSDIYHLRTEMDITGGNNFLYIGQPTQFKAVPIAYIAHALKNQSFKTINDIITATDINDDFVVGSTQLDNDDTNFGRTRLFFNKFRGAFRAGHTNTDSWDYENLGPSSFASGSNTKASGLRSTAMGTRTEALGQGSTALGFETVATSLNSTAMGSNTIASSYSSTAIGFYNLEDPNAIFMVGNGSTSTRRNAFTIQQNGNIELNGQIKFGTAAYIDVGTVNNFDVRINGNIRSTVNGIDNLGSSSFRYNTVFATNGIINTSDRRDKTNITELQYGLNEIMQLKPVRFNWKTNPDQDTKLGLIAQDLMQVIPETVKTHETVYEGDNRNITKQVEMDRLGVYYSDLIPVLIKAIQEQQEIISNQDSKISTLTTELNQLKTLDDRVKQLESLLKTSN